MTKIFRVTNRARNGYWFCAESEKGAREIAMTFRLGMCIDNLKAVDITQDFLAVQGCQQLIDLLKTEPEGMLAKKCTTGKDPEWFVVSNV